jgi:hypothetical protein
MPPGFLKEKTQVVVRVEAPIHEVDADALPGEGLADGLEVGEDGGLLVEELAFGIPHGLEDYEACHALGRE